MVANRGVDTRPEIALRRELHRRGLRFRKHYRPLADLRCTADIVFPRARLAVFVDGCFWHRCPIHATDPASNTAFWIAKFSRNVARDRANDSALTAAGWTVLRIWEHESVDTAANRVSAAWQNAQQP